MYSITKYQENMRRDKNLPLTEPTHGYVLMQKVLNYHGQYNKRTDTILYPFSDANLISIIGYRINSCNLILYEVIFFYSMIVQDSGNDVCNDNNFYISLLRTKENRMYLS